MRDVALVIYAGVLGWCLHKWWEGEREHLVWSAATRAAALNSAKQNGETEPPTA